MEANSPCRDAGILQLPEDVKNVMRRQTLNNLEPLGKAEPDVNHVSAVNGSSPSAV